MRRSDAALALAAALAVAGMGVVLWPRPTATAATDPAAVGIDRPSLAERPRPAALVIADSYTTGSGLAEMSSGCRAATRMGWYCALAAEPGTGYISGGTANRFDIDQGTGKSTSFGERISRLAGTYQPDVVILDGGRNDLFAPPEARLEVTASTLRQVRQTWPRARIVYVVPRFLGRPDDDLGVDETALNMLRDGSDVKNLVVVDPIGGLDGVDTAPLISADGTNPSAAGEQVLSDVLAEALIDNGLRPTP